MNVVREIQRLNQKELEYGSKGSWHDEYRDSAYIFVGGLHSDLTEGDVITIFSQYGEISDINMPRRNESIPSKTDGPPTVVSKPRGFAFLQYMDQKSTILAVDNLNGSKVLERTLRVDHVKDYKHLERGEDGKMKERDAEALNALPEKFMVKDREDSSDETASDADSIDLDDPMRDYLLEQKKEKKRLGITDGRSKKDKKESKEERRARKQEKRDRKEARRREKEREGKRKRDGSEEDDGRRERRKSGRDEDYDYRRRSRSPDRGERPRRTRDGRSPSPEYKQSRRRPDSRERVRDDRDRRESGGYDDRDRRGRDDYDDRRRRGGGFRRGERADDDDESRDRNHRREDR